MTQPDVSYSSQYLSQDSFPRSIPYALRNPELAVKIEQNDSPDLASVPVSIAGHYGYNHHSRDNTNSPFFRFGSDSAPSFNADSFAFMSGQQWHSPIDPQSPNRPFPIHHNPGVNFNLTPTSSQSISFNDEYEDLDEVGDLPVLSGSSVDKPSEKQVRRRSSKACDQCRKLKCKCERTGDGSQCRSCVMLNAKCTFLGPSRKRGPPKGYIDAIEVRLHQTEALIGILLAVAGGVDGNTGDHCDFRARSLIEDLSQDSLAREIINRVDNSLYGFKGRKHPEQHSSKTRGASREQSSSVHGEHPFHTTHPSHEWQDQVVAKMMQDSATKRDNTEHSPSQVAPRIKPTLNVHMVPLDNDAVNEPSPRRLRRKIENNPKLVLRLSPPCSPQSPQQSSSSVTHQSALDSSRLPAPDCWKHDDGEREEGLEDAVGQLSLNEDEQVRFHGKASGLHLLGVKERIDGRNEGGIWKFPKARVWPPLPGLKEKNEEDFAISMPDKHMQDHLMDLYWTYVHPALPIVHKQTFIEALQRSPTTADSPYSTVSQDSASSNSSRIQTRVSTVLLLAMFSIAARYSAESTPLPPDGSMWDAGDTYLESVKTILGSTFSTPRVGTCQALLLLGYREIGIGAMAQAWIYVGMAVRMAQDLGMHKSAEKWQRVGGNMFTASELQERRRIWYGCIVMDKYVSIYIGRPVAIRERDFDTELPNEDEGEERADLRLPGVSDEASAKGLSLTYRCLLCFSASSRLSLTCSRVVQSIYAIRPDPSRTKELANIEEILEKWYLELPESLRFDPIAKSAPPPPHVLTLHLQYWCTVLLLHRPFIRHLSSARAVASSPKEAEIRAASRRSYDMCAQAANKITAIIVSYQQAYSLNHGSVFLCYYVFTASIMHVSTLTTFPDDPQARKGLNQCMDALKQIEHLWPSAGRAWELLSGSKVNLQESPDKLLSSITRLRNSQKRPAEHSLNDGDVTRGNMTSSEQDFYSHSVQQTYGGAGPSSHPNSEPYFPSYDRWPGGTSSGLHLSSLSTSVLPQQYSTGFINNRSAPSSIRGGGSQNLANDRYSQYWNDYSALGQLDPTYGVPEPSGQQQQNDVNVQNPDSMYLSAPYSLFNSIR